ncbi:winged helix DNA-binding protein [Sphingomonas sp.]|jgi:DNA-binding MarR family transcriptional regulator|uniref:winged helix DNA-binding protein n=1 Tax=Sphingomonas sp. TaxID=28214 RepID=UPI0035C80D7E
MHRSEAKGHSDLDLERLKREIDEFAHMLGLTVADSARSQTVSCEQAAPTRATVSGATAMPASRDSERLTTVLAWIKARTNRNQVFGDELFAEPAWDILLDLYANFRLNRTVTIGDLCVASRAPMSTALRWLGLLERRKLVSRTADPLDRRRAFITLTDEGRAKMEKTLDSTTDSNSKLGLGQLRLVK